jgi:iron(III) transport system ATP-binding protein
MIRGTVLQTAPPENLYHRPATREVASFVGEANFLPGTAENGRVRCALGEIPNTGAHEGEVDAMLRPEALRLAARPDGEATVIGREFYGHDQLVKLRLSSGVTLLSRLGGGPGFKVGERVSIEVEGPAVVFPDINYPAEQQ